VRADVHPHASALSTAYVVAISPHETSTMPAMSTWCDAASSRDSGTVRSNSTSAAADSGTLITNTQRQLISDRTPPTSGPRA
jgi:hypothetical protein